AAVGGAITEYVFNAAGQRVSEWNGATHAQLKGKYYWGGKPVAYYANGSTHFEHQDWPGSPATGLRRWGGWPGSPATGLRRWGGWPGSPATGLRRWGGWPGSPATG